MSFLSHSFSAAYSSYRRCIVAYFQCPENINWRVFVIFAVLNFLWIPIVFFFYPETKGLELEDINLIFAKGGFTGGVFSSRGRPVVPHQHAQETELESKQHAETIENVVAS